MTIIFLLIILLIAAHMPRWVNRYKIQCWRNQFNIDQHDAVLQNICKNVNGFALSRLARTQHDAMEFTYGEIEFVSFIALIALTKPTADTRFYDLGSGTGKAILSCAMVFDMQHYCGIELFKELHQAAVTQQQQLQALQSYQHKASKITFINDNFLNTDLGRATLIFINATALFGPTWEQLNAKLSLVNTGTTVITTSKKLASPRFIVIHTTKINVSWGIVVAYIHTKV